MLLQSYLKNVDVLKRYLFNLTQQGQIKSTKLLRKKLISGFPRRRYSGSARSPGYGYDYDAAYFTYYSASKLPHMSERWL